MRRDLLLSRRFLVGEGGEPHLPLPPFFFFFNTGLTRDIRGVFFSFSFFPPAPSFYGLGPILRLFLPLSLFFFFFLPSASAEEGKRRSDLFLSLSVPRLIPKTDEPSLPPPSPSTPRPKEPDPVAPIFFPPFFPSFSRALVMFCQRS